MVQFLFPTVIFSLWNAIGWPPWLKTAPTPTMLASHSNSNTLLKSDSANTGADFSFSLSNLKIFSASVDHINFSFSNNRRLGWNLDMLLKFLINLLYKEANPRNLLTSVKQVGLGQLSNVSVF